MMGIGGGIGGLGLGGFLLLLVLSWATGTNFFSFFSGGGAPADTTGTAGQVSSTPAEERQVDFVDAVMRDVQDTWSQLLPNDYQPTRVVLFRDAINSGCGAAESATGPFYCPQDQRVYLDLGFFQELTDRFGAPGEFARAYVVAHEVGHHVQRLTGIERRARSLQQARPSSANAVSVEIELQADCYAGIWAHYADSARQLVEQGDIDEALTAAASVGDDTIQKRIQGHVNQESFTHGSAAERQQWFRKGYSGGSVDGCNTFQ